MTRQLLIFMILLTTASLSGCSTVDSWQSSAADSLGSMKSWMDTKLKAQPAAGSGFVPMEQLAKKSDLPFNKAWIKEGADYNRYRTLYIAPVNTSFLKQADWWQETIRADQMEQDIQKIASFMQAEFIIAFQEDPRQRLRIVNSPAKGSLTLALALTELVPNHILLNAMKIAGPYGSGLAAAALERKTEAQSTVAFEAKVIDTDSGQVVAMFADREFATVRPIDPKGFTWYGNAQEIIKEWAQQFVEVANRQPGEIIKPASSFSLKPW